MQETSRIDRKALNIGSPVFKVGTTIPERYTCEGKDMNPPLEIGNIPAEAKSLVLIVDDPDAPRGTWLHWLVWNIPIVNRINENEVPGVQGLNSFGRIAYGGPCPPSGTHRYYFKVYALNRFLDLAEGATLKEVDTAMQSHVIAYGEVVGLYKKQG